MATVFSVHGTATTEKGGERNNNGKQILDHTKLLNQVRGPTVAAWDLRVPEVGDGDAPHLAPSNVKVRLRKHRVGDLEKRIGAFDKRSPILTEDIKPGGKYRSIVKLFLQYTKSEPGSWYIGTGWLIKDDLLVTAGHCSYDWEDGEQHLKAVKAYIGYNGKDSVGKPNVQFRAGKRVATSAQWIQSAEGHHDVAFIQLEKPFDNVVPFSYADTPETGEEILGVIGYPGDLRGGHYMYEGWYKTKWDLANSDRYLDYVIDTEGGNSGSPVLSKVTGKSIGVHVLGGSIANSATVIGPLGNIFSYYIRAIELAPGAPSTTSAILSAPASSVPVPNFIYVDFPSAEKGSVVDGDLPNGSVNGDECVNGVNAVNGVNGHADKPGDRERGHVHDDDDLDSNDFFLRTITFLREHDVPFSVDDKGAVTIGKRSNGAEPIPENGARESPEDRIKRIKKGVRPGGFESGKLKKFTELPVPLGAEVFPRTEDGKEGVDDLPNAPPPDQTEFQTAFFVGFPNGKLKDPELSTQIALQKNVGIFWADATTKVERTVQSKVKEKKLDPKDLIKVSSYRAKCFDSYVRNMTTWIEAGAELSKRMELHVKRVDFHVGILLAVLEGIAVPATAFKQLEKVVTSIGDGVLRAGTEERKESLTFWVSMTLYHMDEHTGTISTKIRTVFFESNETTYTVTAGKSSFQKIDFVLEYQQYDATFNNDIFDPISKGIRDDLIDKGKAMMKQSVLDVDV